MASTVDTVPPVETRVEPRLARHRRELSQGRAALEAAYRARAEPLTLLRQQAQLVDRLLRRLWREARMPHDCALLAVGGYGRGTLFPHSDVDVLILLSDTVGEAARGLVADLVSQLWDVGLEPGHSVRTVEECIDEGAQDITVQTNLLEARRVIGSRALTARFEHAVRSALDPRAFLEAKLLEQQQRHNRFNDTAYNLEPNIKESPGGLRDLTNILWIAGASGTTTGWEGRGCPPGGRATTASETMGPFGVAPSTTGCGARRARPPCRSGCSDWR